VSGPASTTASIASTIVHDGWIHRPTPLAGAELRTWEARIEQTRRLRAETHVSLRAPYDCALRRAYESHTAETARASSDDLRVMLEAAETAAAGAAGVARAATAAAPVAPAVAPETSAPALALTVQPSRRRAA
jgi:hypothetical protein